MKEEKIIKLIQDANSNALESWVNLQWVEIYVELGLICGLIGLCAYIGIKINKSK